MGLRSNYIAALTARPPVSTTYTDYVVLPANWALIAANYNAGTQFLTESAGNNFHLAYPANAAQFTPNKRHVFIAEAKAATRTRFQIRSGGYSTFDLSSGENLGGANCFSYSMKPLSDGWYECMMVPHVTNSDVNLIIENASGDIIYVGDGTSGLQVRNVRIAEFKHGRIGVNQSQSSLPSTVAVSPTYKYRGGMLLGDSFATPSSTDPTKRVNDVSQRMLMVPAGTGGRTLAQIVAAFTTDVGFYAPSFCVLQGGINTINSASSNPLASMQSSVADFVAACQAIGAAPVLVNLPPDKTYVSWSLVRQGWMNAYNLWLPGYAASIDARMIDILTVLSADGETLRASMDSGDGLHPNAAGYAAIGDAYVEALDNVLL